MSDLVVVVVFVPSEQASPGAADAVRAAADAAGAGAVGDYRACSFSAPGHGRFLPLEGAAPAIGEVGRSEVVEEVRVEVVCDRDRARAVVEAMLAAHPYEEPAWHAYATLGLDDL